MRRTPQRSNGLSLRDMGHGLGASVHRQASGKRASATDDGPRKAEHNQRGSREERESRARKSAMRQRKEEFSRINKKAMKQFEQTGNAMTKTEERAPLVLKTAQRVRREASVNGGEDAIPKTTTNVRVNN